MSDLVIEQVALPDPNQLYNKGKQELGNFAELRVGAGSSIFYTDKEGSRWGHIDFEQAKAFIKVDGTYKFKSSDGTVLFDSLGTGGNFVNVINTALNTSSKTILQDFTFQATDYAGALKAGNPTWDEGTGLITGGSGVLINARGILGAANGVATFTLDATTGSATFAGTLTAASGTLGSITIGTNAWHVDSSGNMWWGNFANYASASIKISSAGVVTFTSGSFRGTLNADDITAGTLTGRTVKATGGSGADVWINSSDGTVSFYYANSRVGYIHMSDSAIMLAHSDNDLYLQSNDTMVFDCGSTLYMFVDAAVVVDYNYNGGTDSFYIYDNSSLTAEFTAGGDLWISDTLTAGTVVDRTPHYDGDALSELRNIKGKNGEIDHDTLPLFMQHKTRRVKTERDPVTRKLSKLGEEVSTERSLGAAISMLIKAVVDLDDKIENLKKLK